MSSPWKRGSESEDEPWSAGEAWRGDTHPEDDRDWLGEDLSEWEGMEAEAEEDTETEAVWRGDLHPGDWPENMAGPEYWLFKRYGC